MTSSDTEVSQQILGRWVVARVLENDQEIQVMEADGDFWQFTADGRVVYRDLLAPVVESSYHIDGDTLYVQPGTDAPSGEYKLVRVSQNSMTWEMHSYSHLVFDLRREEAQVASLP